MMADINALTRPLNVIPGDISGGHKAQNLQQAAEQFEALFLRSMLQQMRKASDALSNGNDPFTSKQQVMVRDFYDDKLASTLASQRSSGIAEMIIRQLSPPGTDNVPALKLTDAQAALSDKATPVAPVTR